MFRAIVWHPKSNIIKFETGWRNSATACKGEVESKILELAWDGHLDSEPLRCNVTDEKGSVVWKNEGWGWTENK